MITLNGWQRLWIVLSVLYLIPLIGVTSLLWPTPETTPHREEFLKRMPADIRGSVRGAYNDEASWRQGKHRRDQQDRKVHAILRDLAARELAKEGKAEPLPPFIADFTGPVTFPNGVVFDVRAARHGGTEVDSRVRPAYWAIVVAEARGARLRMLAWMALLWIVPCLALYALGWAIAWVRRGFRAGAVLH
jgi:hypothetical protein